MLDSQKPNADFRILPPILRLAQKAWGIQALERRG
jgi:hypothetical protein